MSRCAEASIITGFSTRCVRLWHFIRNARQQPRKWYPRAADGTVRKYDDLPADYHENVSMEKPFGLEPVLSEADVDDLVAFLQTLTDGYRPGK